MSMFKFLLLLLFVQQEAIAKREALLEYENTVDTTKYAFRYKTNSGVVREEFGEMTNPGTADQNYVVKGRTVNYFPDGSLQIVEYVADKYGYHPKIIFLTSHQLRKVYLESGQSIHQPVSKITGVRQDSSTGIDTDKKTEERTKSVLTADNVQLSGHLVDKNLDHVSPQVMPDVNVISARNTTKESFGYKENSSISLDNDYDYDDIHNRIGGGTAAALLGIG